MRLNYTYSVESGGKLNGLTHEQTKTLIHDALAEWTPAFGAKFKLKTSGHANKRFFFRNNAYMARTLNDGTTPLGLAYRNGVILCNNEREVNWLHPTSRIGPVFISHEMLHTFGYRHSQKPMDIRNSNLSASWFSGDELKRLQRDFTKPKNKFYPPDRAVWGNLVNSVKARSAIKWEQHAKLVAERDASTEYLVRRVAQDKIEDLVRDIRELDILEGSYASEWFKVNNYWKRQKVPMMHVA